MDLVDVHVIKIHVDEIFNDFQSSYYPRKIIDILRNLDISDIIVNSCIRVKYVNKSYQNRLFILVYLDSKGSMHTRIIKANLYDYVDVYDLHIQYIPNTTIFSELEIIYRDNHLLPEMNMLNKYKMLLIAPDELNLSNYYMKSIFPLISTSITNINNVTNEDYVFFKTIETAFPLCKKADVMKICDLVIKELKIHQDN